LILCFVAFAPHKWSKFLAVEYIYNCNNEYLLKDLLNSIDTGINYQLTNHQDALTKLIIENTNITAETGNEVICLREDIQSLL